MNYARMQNLVRLSLGEMSGSNSYYSDDEVKAMINDSLVQVATDVPSLLTFHDIPTTAATQRYSLPRETLQLKDVHLIINGTLKRQLRKLGMDEFEMISASNFSREGEPAFFKMELGATQVAGAAAGLPGDLWLYPVPDGFYTVRVYSYQRPTELVADGEISELPELLHWAVIYHATAMLSLKNDDQNKHTIMMIQYDRSIARGRRWYTQHDRSNQHFTQDAMGYGRSSLIRR